MYVYSNYDSCIVVQELCLRIVLLLSAVAITAVVGNGRGAPPAACDSITPEGHGTSTATDPVPYNVNISSLDNGYIAGETYTSECTLGLHRVPLYICCSVAIVTVQLP